MSHSSESPWTHNICEKCWFKRDPNRTPLKLTGEDLTDVCCFCGSTNQDGIYVRHDPKTTICNKKEYYQNQNKIL